MTLPFPIDFLEYLKKLPYILSIDSNRTFKNSSLIIAAFFTSIYFSGFLIPFLSLKFNILDSLDSINVIKFFIFNAIPISIIYALIIYLVTFKANRDFINLVALFVQGIKFFTIFNVFLALFMAIAIDQLIVNSINLLCNKIDANIYSMNIPTPLILIATASFMFGIGWILLKPTYLFIAQSYSQFSKRVILLFLLSALGLISFLNHNLFSLSIYPKQDMKNLIIADKFCKEVLEIKMIQNKECSDVTVQKLVEFRSACEKMVMNN